MVERDLPPDPGRPADTQLLDRGLSMSPRVRLALIVLLGMIVLFLGFVTFDLVL